MESDCLFKVGSSSFVKELVFITRSTLNFTFTVSFVFYCAIVLSSLLHFSFYHLRLVTLKGYLHNFIAFQLPCLILLVYAKFVSLFLKSENDLGEIETSFDFISSFYPIII